MRRLWTTVVIVAAAIGASPTVSAEREPALPAAAEKAPANHPPAKEAGPAAAAAAEKLLDAQIQRHIQNLASSFVEVADGAEASLLELKYRAADALEKAAKHPNPEVARRAGRLLETINQYTHAVLDATGQPIVGGKLEVTFGDQKINFVPDEKGRVMVARPGDGSALGKLPSAFSFSLPAHFSHPDYGSAELPIQLNNPKKVFTVPLVRRGTPAYERALRGVVLDPDDKPVAGAVIKCLEIRQPVNGMITTESDVSLQVDDKGRFTYYSTFFATGAADPQALIPAGSKFLITVQAASDTSLFPHLGEHTNAAEAKIMLERPKRLHTFKFETRGGHFMSDPVQLNRIVITYSRPGGANAVNLHPRSAAEGARLVPGTYRARWSDGGFLNTLNYLPLEVTKDSPEELVFRRPPPIAFRGRVLDGVSGKPMAGAFVFAFSSVAQGSFARLTPGEWQALHKLPDRPQLSDPALKVVSNLYGIRSVSRTDDQGRYEIIQEPEGEVYGFIAVDENYLPIRQVKQPLKIDEQNCAGVPDLLLFPAATVLIRPVSSRANISVMPTWQFEKQGQPEWFVRFRDAANSGNRYDRDAANSAKRYEYANWMRLNESQPIFVPGGVALKIQFSAPYSEELSAITVPKVIRLQPGESQKLDPVELPDAIRLKLEVVDARGVPVAGTVVRRMYKPENIWSLPHPTDAKGIAFCYVNQQSAGHFRVELRSPSGVLEGPNLDVPFEVGTEAVTDQPYKIVLTDEQTRALRGAAPAR